MENQTVVPIQPHLTAFKDHVWASSVDVADHFGKRHNNVLRDIRDLEIPEEFRLLNFEQSSYFNEQNKEQPAVDMTRDGFTLLAMGFTGPKAMQFKIAYLEAFNRMETELQGRTDPNLHRKLDELTDRHMALLDKNRELMEQEIKRLEQDMKLAESGKRVYMTQNQRNKIVQLRSEGWTTSMIAKHIGFTRQAVLACEKRMKDKAEQKEVV
jgi:Rha family phage regulatory protein